MRKKDSAKRLIILALGILGLCALTSFYVHDWFAYYYHHIYWKTENRFNFNGHVLMVALYFVLLFFFSHTYGAVSYTHLDVYKRQIYGLAETSGSAPCRHAPSAGGLAASGD